MFYLYLFDAIVELHAMNVKMLNDFLIGRWKWISYVIEVYLNHDLFFVHVVKAFITLNWKNWYKSMSPYSSKP